jgi:hypothetical protein
MQKSPTRRSSKHGNRVGQVVGAVVGALQRIDGNVELNGAFAPDFSTDRLSDVQHWRVVALALSDGHTAVKWSVVKRASHRFDGGTVGGVLVSKTAPFCAGQGRHVDGFEQVGPDVSDAHGPRMKDG